MKQFEMVFDHKDYVFGNCGGEVIKPTNEFDKKRFTRVTY